MTPTDFPRVEAPSTTSDRTTDPSPADVVELPTLRAANVARQAIWCPEQVPDLSFRGNELAGETGEVCNVIKKLERERLGWRGSRDTVEHLAEELADVVICADLVAIAAGIDLDAAVAAKFNATSDKVGIAVRLAPPAAVLITSLQARAEKAERVEALVEALTPSGNTKAAYIGEFTIAVERRLDEDGDPDDEEGSDPYEHITVPWSTIKEIMAAIRARALANKETENV